MTEIDVGAVLAAKAPRIARLLPRWAVEWLRRTVREREINHILRSYGTLPPRDFIRACFREWGVTYSSEGLERLDPAGRYLFASNHPFGGMDGMMLADKLIDRFGDPPEAVKGLIDVSLLRNTAAAQGIKEISQRADSLLLYPEVVDMEKASRLASALKGRVMLNAGAKPYLTVKVAKGEKPLDTMRLALGIMAGENLIAGK